MLAHDPRQRPTMASVLQHPFFMRPNQKMELFSLARRQWDQFEGPFNARWGTGSLGTWQQRLGPDMKRALCGEKKSRYGHLPSELVRCVRNLQQHWKELGAASYAVLAFGGRSGVTSQDVHAARKLFTIEKQNKCLYSSLVASGLFPRLVAAIWRTLRSLGRRSRGVR